MTNIQRLIKSSDLQEARSSLEMDDNVREAWVKLQEAMEVALNPLVTTIESRIPESDREQMEEELELGVTLLVTQQFSALAKNYLNASPLLNYRY